MRETTIYEKNHCCIYYYFARFIREIHELFGLLFRFESQFRVYTNIYRYIYNMNTLSIPACGYTSVNTPNIITNTNYNTCTLLFRRYSTYDNENK